MNDSQAQTVAKLVAQYREAERILWIAEAKVEKATYALDISGFEENEVSCYDEEEDLPPAQRRALRRLRNAEKAEEKAGDRCEELENAIEALDPRVRRIL
jgi:hypothetical protein